jgi:CMP-N,N'-diacetyllegionaminic acid synthase
MGDKIRHFEVEEGFDVHSMEDLQKPEEWFKNN